MAELVAVWMIDVINLTLRGPLDKFREGAHLGGSK